MIYVPFGTGTQVNGYFSLQNFDRENAFSESDVRLLQTLAGSMGIALENARLFNAEQQRAAELCAISTVTQALVAETDLGFNDPADRESDVEYLCSRYRLSGIARSADDPIRFPFQHGESFTTLKLGEGLTSTIIQTGEPLLSIKIWMNVIRRSV